MTKNTDDDPTRQISDYLRNYQDAAQQLAGMLTRKGSSAGSAEGSEEGAESVGEFADYQYISGLQNVVGAQLGDIADVAQKMIGLMLQRPEVAYAKAGSFWKDMFRIATGTSDLAPEKGDHRFDDPAWSNQPFYRQAMQSYLSMRNLVEGWVADLPIDPKEAERIRFTSSMLTEALAPSNWPTNPAALKRFLETGGASAVRGLTNLVDDLVHNNGMPSMVKRGALKVGEDMGNTPGKVVYRCEVFELIQYAPTTGEVYARPYLMVPPQINKYYFYDLSPKKSLVRFGVESGLQVFTLSWRNPTPEHRDWSFETYISAIEEAIGVISEITGAPDCNIEGGCVGGITVAGLLASQAERGVRTVNAATLLVTMLDTSAETQLGALAIPAMLEMAKINSAQKGVMEGAEMGRIFAMLRPNDLIWSYWVNNYLLGNEPPTFDVLAWNADTSRMAAGLHRDILDLVKNNTLVRGEFEVHGKPVTLASIDCDQFWMAGSADHITPWPACYASARLVGGNRVFVVSDGGHIQSMISSPSNPKAKFHVGAGADLPEDPEAWFAAATEHNSSWWLYWRDWITQRSGELRKAPDSLGSAQHPPLTDAPGTYVFE
ncbi:MAG: PHA/PHB synthase family protein [Rhodospirillales bacterium]